MKKYSFFAAAILFISIAFVSCEKNTNTNAVGGNLPTNYISILDSSFKPASLIVSSGSSITFVNNTATAKSIITTDSVTIKATTIAPNASFTFNKDTAGTFNYHLTDKVSATGIFVLTP